MPQNHLNFGTLLRTLRTLHGLTQEAVSDLLGGRPGHTQISRYECGENLPRHRNDAENLAYAMGCSGAETKRLVEAYVKAKAQREGYDQFLAA